ncbi:jg14814, partial [Pararge aegeria aegeria]
IGSKYRRRRKEPRAANVFLLISLIWLARYHLRLHRHLPPGETAVNCYLEG